MVAGPKGLVPSREFVEAYLHGMSDLSGEALPAFDLFAVEPLLDSADLRPADWVRIADAVVRRYHDYDGFVVLHGTDTMAYSTSAVSFLLPGLGKPVVFTGAQLPLSDVRSDGREHLVTSLLLAADGGIPEVSLYFGGVLLRGNRAQKVHSNHFVAFASGALPPLARVGVQIEVARHLVRPAGPGVPVDVTLPRAPEVVAVRLFPGITARMLRQLMAPPVEGVVLEAYGAGTFPTQDPDLLAAVREAVDRGVVVVTTSQVHAGRVAPSRYGTGAALADAGAASAHDLTPEAALTKLYVLLAHGAPAADVRRRLVEDVVGELTVGDSS